jgi:hypothetical protein
MASKKKPKKSLKKVTLKPIKNLDHRAGALYE